MASRVEHTALQVQLASLLLLRFPAQANRYLLFNIMDPAISSKLQLSATTIRTWLKNCTTAHADSACTSSPTSGPPQKRLIFLDPGSNVSRLVDTPNPVPSYVALSYVWGPTESNIRTLTSNLPQMYTSIPPSSLLPLTLQHVFHLVRLLSFRYLWIDSLCITQDDDVEKAVEIGRMEYVYLNSALQISAQSSPSATAGLLRTREYLILPEQRDEHHLIMKACRSLRQRIWDERLRRDYCLLTRGWAYQERMLARRIVHFTCFELVWECKGGRWCECGMVERRVEGMGGSVINNMSAAFEECVSRADGGEEGRKKVVGMWRECVMGYSRGQLSVKDDRLAAISGVGRMLGGREGEEAYVGGMRSEALPSELLWRADTSCRLAIEKTRRPSWSWGSVDCGVDWPTNGGGTKGEAMTDGEKSLAHVVSGTYFEEGATGVEVVGLEAKPESPSTADADKSVGFRRVEYARLTLKTRVVPVSIRRHPDTEDWRESYGTEWAIEGGQSGLLLPFYQDVEFGQAQDPDEGQETALASRLGVEKYTLVEIATIISGSRIWEAGLVGRESLHGMMPGCVERVGMAGFPNCVPQEGLTSWFDGADAGIVSLV
ncbi:heterokaryon incompatibility protein-domain-containing protein [Coniochaeta sp. 2T2.1]|nr:heterokaryon incompatibility protein-domain-containing protein [Coniochaeta sp. 2T2.1]